MPTINLLDADPNLSIDMFRDANGNIPVIKSINRLGHIVYDIPNDNAQIVYRILLYEASGQNVEVYNRICANHDSYRLTIANGVRVERLSQTNYQHSVNGERPRRLTGLKFIVEIPNRGSWGRYTPYTSRTASVVRGKITLNSIRRVFRTVIELLENHVLHETERQTADRIRREERERLSIQASAFIRGILDHYPLENTDRFSWNHDYTKFNLSISLDKFQIAKVLDAIHNIRRMQTNPLDVEYLLKKDY
jgi:hypothetical protein